MLSGVWKKSVNVEIEKLGAEGWELVAVLPGKEDRREHGKKFHFVFPSCDEVQLMVRGPCMPPS